MTAILVQAVDHGEWLCVTKLRRFSNSCKADVLVDHGANFCTLGIYTVARSTASKVVRDSHWH